jgi:uncharacterized membrane protein
MPGPAFNNTMWKNVTGDRDAGSPEWLPIYQQGQDIRFVARADNLDRPDASWAGSRIVCPQHASDPIALCTRPAVK